MGVATLALTAMLASALPAPVEASKKSAAMAALKVAKHYYDAKQFAKAAERFHEAWGIDPNPAFLFNAARSEMRAFKLDQAEGHFKQYLGLKRIDAEGRRRASVHLDEVAAQRKVMAQQRKAIVVEKQRAVVAEQKAATATKTAKAGKQTDWLTTGLWAGGGALLGTSGLLYLLARAGRSDTNAMEVKSEEQLKEHNGQVQAQNGLRNLAIGAAAVGGGLSVWAFLRSGSSGDSSADAGTKDLHMAPWTDGRGLVFVGRF